MKRIAFVAILLLLSGCSSESGARRALTSAGYTEIEISGWAPLSCSRDDLFKIKFSAKSPSGAHVDGAVCSGWFKGATIRTY